MGLLDQACVRDNKTLTLQENHARAVVDGEKTAKTPRFVNTTNGAKWSRRGSVVAIWLAVRSLVALWRTVA